MHYCTPWIQRARPSVALALVLAAATFVSPGVSAAQLQEITVTVPGTRTLGHDASGAPIEQVTASARVQYERSLLSTHAGRALLQARVSEVARRLCREIDDAAAMAAGDDSRCVQQAVYGAKVQIAAQAVEQRVG